MLYRNFNSIQLVSKSVVSLRNEKIYLFSTSVELETDNVSWKLTMCVCLSVCPSQNFGARQNPVKTSDTLTFGFL